MRTPGTACHRVVVYFVFAMCLFSAQGYEEMARLLTQGLERSAAVGPPSHWCHPPNQPVDLGNPLESAVGPQILYPWSVDIGRAGPVG
ncbi:transposase domain-containing protein [Streptomyces sp. NPDC054887]